MRQRTEPKACPGSQLGPCPNSVLLHGFSKRCPDCQEVEIRERVRLLCEKRKAARAEGREFKIKLSKPCVGTPEGPCPHKAFAISWRADHCAACQKECRRIRHNDYARRHPEYSRRSRDEYFTAEEARAVDEWQGGRKALMALAWEAGLIGGEMGRAA